MHDQFADYKSRENKTYPLQEILQQMQLWHDQELRESRQLLEVLECRAGGMTGFYKILD